MTGDAGNTGQIPPPWRLYESQIFERLRAKATGEVTILPDQHIDGKISKVSRQVDVLVHGTFANLVPNLRVVVDCKCWKSAIDVGDVERLLGMIEDVGADRGLLITTTGASAGSYRRAGHTVAIEVVPFDDLAEWADRMPTVALTGGASHGTLSYYAGSDLVTEVVSREYAEELLERLRIGRKKRGARAKTRGKRRRQCG